MKWLKNDNVLFKGIILPYLREKNILQQRLLLFIITIFFIVTKGHEFEHKWDTRIVKSVENTVNSSTFLSEYNKMQ